MNERLQELADQCHHRYSQHNIDLEKFAELIVREMCQVINADCELQYGEGVITNLGGLNQARELIKQHFGVES
jgi:hypothetical protein